MNRPIVKITCLILYLGLAGISCWATERSLSLYFHSWPKFAVWIVTVAFFLVATYGTKLIVDSLSSSSFIDDRKLKLCGGIFLVIVFWLITGVPTNTHTFLYDAQIGTVISKDIETTNKYLEQIIVKGDPLVNVYNAEGKRIKDSTEILRCHVNNQFNGNEPPHKSGDGENVAKYIRDINILLHSDIHAGSTNSKDPAILNRYNIEIANALENALRPYILSKKSANDAWWQKRDLAALKDSIKNSQITGTLSKVEIDQCKKELEKGYGIIAAYKDFVDFDPDTDDKSVYTQEKVETRTKGMDNVYTVFVDFLKGDYPSYLYLVVISILVDISAFIVFKFIF